MDNKVLQESTKVAQEAAKMIGGTFTQGVGFKASEGGSSTAPVTNPAPSALMSELEKRLMGGADGVSSRYGNIENTIRNSVKAVSQASEASASRINTDYNSERDFMLGQAQSNVDSFSESRSGFATQLASLRNLTDSTDKALRDLSQRKQDALAANDSAAAEKIAALEMKAIEFKMQKEEQFYNNAFQFAGLELQKSAQEQARTQFTERIAFDREQRVIDRQDKMASLAAQAGVEMTSTDTFETLSTKIAAIKDEERRIDAQSRLSKLKGEVEEEEVDLVYDDLLSNAISKGMSAEAAARAVVTNMREAGQLLSRKEYDKVYARALQMFDDYKKTQTMAEAEQGGSFLGRIREMFSGVGGGRQPFRNETTPAVGRGISTSTPATPEEVFFGIPETGLFD